ncbi:hypothetical protein DPM19_00765 [Actinomadura craniellae]|uniref:Uncharacterized protein n=1 Tax=Actinomadura craniellae TaxID=2231787 RepID=A0A365HCB7_9ACTN|nr:hypothetical protein [Actinomadura craniellae]RAY16737.1 hypothetical protein DPM19_00765 [Actinomadura craniellae]
MNPRARLAALAEPVQAHGFVVRLLREGLAVRNPHAADCCDEGGRMSDLITCRRHPGDAGRYWFFTSWQEPIAEADRVMDAITRIKGYLTPRHDHASTRR